MLPPYSVLMSVYEKETATCLLKSLNSMAMQTHTPDEIILVCDGILTPELENAINIFQEQYIGLLKCVRLETNIGLGGALNQGLRHCKNEYIARMDSDDISLPKRAETQLRWMLEKALDVCGSNIAEFQNEDTDDCIKSVPLNHAEILHYAKKRNPFNHPSVIFKKSIILVAGNYQPMPFFEDYYLWVRALQMGAKCGNVPEVLLRMRSNQNFYARRGGAAYARYAAAFWRQVAKLGFITKLEACVTIIPRQAIAFIPTKLRIQIYRFLLRS